MAELDQHTCGREEGREGGDLPMRLFYYMRGFPTLLGVLSQLAVAIQFLLPSADEALPLIFVIACGVPQVVLLLSVTYRQLKGSG